MRLILAFGLKLNKVVRRMKQIILAYTLAMTSYSSFAGISDSLENMAAIGAAPAACGFKVNEQMVNISVSALFDNPSDLTPGGKHWPELQNNLQRIKNLTATAAGKKSFCNRISKELSAFFD